MSAAVNTGRIIPYLLLGIGVFILAWVFLVAGPLEDLERLENKEKSLAQQFEQTVSLERNLEALKAQQKELREALTHLKTVLPDSFRVALSEWAWHEDAWYYGVKINNLEFGSERTADFFAHRRFSLKARGSFRAIHNFLYDRFYASGPAVRLADIELRSKGNDEPLVLVLTGIQYRYLTEDEL